MLKAIKNPVRITTEFGRVSVVCIRNGQRWIKEKPISMFGKKLLCLVNSSPSVHD